MKEKMKFSNKKIGMQHIFMNLRQISYIGYLGAAFHLTCWRSMRADDLGSIYDKKTFTDTQMKFELFNTLLIEALPYYQLDLIQEIKYTSQACNDEITVNCFQKFILFFSGVRQETVEYVILLMLQVMLTLAEKLPRQLPR